MNYQKYIFLIILLGCFQIYAQETVKKDPKVGLVLSGGGAKGLAHIGALKVIEEAGVRIDYIGGTSMGAIVGSLYAAGYSPKQMDSIFRETAFDELLQDQIPRSAMSFYEKRNHETYIISLPFNKFKISLPPSVSKGQNLYNLLTKLFFNVDGIKDFNKLPIPFFCMATDIETGESIKLDKGYLPRAVAASAAIPSFFEPVPYGDRLLVDGGVNNNYPVDEVLAMGADIIIGVDVQDSLSKRDKLRSATDILVQINFYNTINDMEEKLKKTDVHIKPDVTEYDVLSFGKGMNILESGYKAAIDKLPQLDSIADLQIKKPVKRPPQKVKDSFLINELVFEGNEKYTKDYLRGKLRYRTEEHTTFKNIDQGMSNLAATNNFYSVRYELRPNGEGYKLKVPISEKQTDMFLKFGLHYDGLYKTAGLLNITKKHLFFDDDVAYLDFILGDFIRYNFHYYLDKGFYWSLGVKSSLNTLARDVRINIPFSPDPEDLEVDRVRVGIFDLTNQIYMQTLWREEFTFGLGLEHKYREIKSNTLFYGKDKNRLIEESGSFFSTYGFLKFDTLNDKYFPSEGIFFDGDFHWYLAKGGDIDGFNPFSIAKAKLGFAIPITKTISFDLFTEGGFRLGVTQLDQFNFLLGGWGNEFVDNITPFLGYDYMNLSGDSYVKATLNLDWEPFKKNHFNLTANYANLGNGLFHKAKWFSLPKYSGYAIGYGYESFLGPAQVKFNWSPETGDKFLTFSIGFWF